MIKSKLKVVLLAAAMSLGIAASANAGLTQSFVSSDNKVFSLDNVREVSFPAGVVTLKFVNGESSGAYLQDTSGSVAAKMKTSGAFTQYIQAGTSGVYYNPLYAKYIICTNTGTLIGWANTGSEQLTDGCQLFNSIKNLSN